VTISISARALQRRLRQRPRLPLRRRPPQRLLRLPRRHQRPRQVQRQRRRPPNQPVHQPEARTPERQPQKVKKCTSVPKVASTTTATAARKYTPKRNSRSQQRQTTKRNQTTKPDPVSSSTTAMRRSFSLLTVLSVSAWAQPAPAPAQPPIVVQVQMPPISPPNPWTHALDLAVPGFIGALSALIAVYLTNRNNRRTNLENHRHEMERWLRENTLQAKRRFYTALITTAYTFEDRIVRYGAFTYTLRQSLEAGERVPSEFVAQEKLQVNEIDTAKLALVSAISLGLILLDESRFAELRRLNDLALALMGEVTETRRTGNIQPSRMAFQKQITVIAEFAKSDLSCSPY